MDASLATETAFTGLLRTAGSDNVMQRVQKDFFAERRIDPARKLAREYGIESPLGIAIRSTISAMSGLSGLNARLDASKSWSQWNEESKLEALLNRFEVWLHPRAGFGSFGKVWLKRVNDLREQLKNGNGELVT